MIRYGVARKYAKDLPNYIVKLNQEDIDAYEMGFAYGIPEKISKDTINLAERRGVALSCHLPFWINLGNSNDEKNVNYLVSGLKIAEQLGSVAVFHLGFYGGKNWNNIKDHAKKIIQKALEISKVKKAKLGIETTGKQSALGTLDEVIELVNIINDKRVIPIIDWSHLFARNNGTWPSSYEDFVRILNKLEKELGYKPFYFHGGGIEYKNGNEIKHISAKSYQPPLSYLFAAMQDLGYKDIIFIVESPDSINDVKWLKDVWKSPRKFFKNMPKKTENLLDFEVRNFHK